MIRERSEIISFTRDDLERVLRYVCKERIVGSLFIGKFGEQSVRWHDDGSAHVITTYTEGDLTDLPAAEPTFLPKQKKKSKR